MAAEKKHEEDMIELKKVEKEKAKALQKQIDAAAAEVGKNGELTFVMHL